MVQAKKVPAKPVTTAAVEAPVAAAPAATPVAPVPAAAPVAEAVTAPLATALEQVRASTEQGISQLRERYASMKTQAEAATDKLEQSLTAMQTGSRDFNLKVLELFRANTLSGFAHVQAVMASASLPDALKLQQDYVKAMVETAQSQSRELSELANKLAGDVVAPVRESIVLPFKR